MTKLTKNEKILRKGNEKWKNFLAEGAFKKTVAEDWSPKSEEEYNSMSLLDVSKIWTKIHKSMANASPEEVQAAEAELAMIKPIIKAKGDVIRAKQKAQGIDPDAEPEADMTYAEARMGGESGEDWDDLLSQIMNASPDADAAEMAEKAYDLVEAGNIDGATDLIADIINNTSDPDTSETAEKAYDAVEALQMNEARMSEYGKMDAEQGLPPTKIGRGNEEYMAAYNAVLQARGEEPLDIQKPDQAYLDALRSGQLQEAVDKRARQLLSEGLTPKQVKEKILEEGLGDFIRKGADFVKAKTGLGRTTKTRELYNKMKFEKDKYFEFRDKFYPDATDVRNFMEFVEQNARKQGGGRGGMMSDLAYRAISREKFKTMDSPITYLKQARKLANNIEKMMLDGAVDQKGDKTFKVIRSMAESIVKDFEQARAYLKELRVAIKRAQKSGDAQALKDIYNDQVEHERYLSQSQARADKAFAEKAKEAERKRRQDKKKDDDMEFTGGQMSSKSRFAEENEKKKFKVGEFVYIVAGSLKGATGKILKPVTTSTGEEGFAIELYSPFSQAGNEVVALAGDLESGGTTDGMELYDIDEKKNLKEEVIEDFEIELEGGITFADVEEAGLVTPGVDSVIDNGDGYAQVYSEPQAMVKMAKTLEAMTGVMVSPKSHGAVDEEMSKKDFVKMVRDKGKVPNLKGDMGPISGLEGPFQYRSGAVLYYDPKAGKYYDRGRDMYLDDQEAAELTMEDRTTMSSDPEFDQVQDIAADMLELSARSRIPVNLKSVQSALEAQSFDSKMEKGMLIVDNKYVIAVKKSLPATAQKISFTDYGIDYLSNLQGEQQNLPLG